MSALDDLVGAVQGSEKIDAGTKGVITAFLQGAGPAMGVLAPEVLQELVQQLAGNNRAVAVTTIADSLTQEQVVQLLDVAERGMAAAADAKAASQAAIASIVDALGQAALTAVTQAIVAAL